MTFSQKKIDLTINLGQGQFGEEGYESVLFSGLRARVQVDVNGNEQCAQAHAVIYGLPPREMNRLTAITTVEMMNRRNGLQIAAGDDAGMTTIFQGQITDGRFDLSPPDAAVSLTAIAGQWEKIKPATPTSHNGSVSVVSLIERLALKMGYVFENNGVDAVIATPYLPGTLWEQARRLVEAAGINWCIDRGTVAIWPRNGSRSADGDIPLIDKNHGMIGYPTFSASWLGISVSCLFRPELKIGGVVQVISDLVNCATGYWTIKSLTHTIDSELPGGAWVTSFHAIACPPERVKEILNG